MDPPDSSLIEESYCGPKHVASLLYKNKWNATVGLLFGRYVKRFFVVKMEKQLFCYYDDIYYNYPHEYPVNTITQVMDTPMTQNYPSESKIGFSVITTTRAFHLFAANEQIKAEFVYALACLKTIPVRPPLAFAHQQYMVYWKPPVESAIKLPDKTKPLATNFAEQIRGPEKTGHSFPVSVPAPQPAARSEEKKAEIPGDERINSASTTEAAKPAPERNSKLPSAAEPEKKSPEVKQPTSPENNNKVPEDDHQNAGEKVPSSDTIETIIPVIAESIAPTKNKVPEKINPAGKGTKRTSETQRTKVQVIDCGNLVAKLPPTGKGSRLAPEKRIQQPETVKIERGGVRYSSGSKMADANMVSGAINPFECGGEHRPKPRPPPSKLQTSQSSAGTLAKPRIEDLLQIIRPDECNNKEVLRKTAVIAEECLPEKASTSLTKHLTEESKGWDVDTTEANSQSQRPPIQKSKEAPIRGKETFEYEWDDNEQPERCLTSRLPVLKHEHSLPIPEPVARFSNEKPKSTVPKKEVIPEVKKQPIATKEGRKGETFEEAW